MSQLFIWYLSQVCTVASQDMKHFDFTGHVVELIHYQMHQYMSCLNL